MSPFFAAQLNLENNMRCIVQVTGGEPAIVSFSDLAYLSRFKWRNCGGYAKSDAIGLMHRVVVERLGLVPQQVDHINRNKRDNRRENLRPANSAENQYNVTPRRGSTSKHKGVYWYKSRRKWRAKIRHDFGKIIHLGYFDNEKDAAVAYNNAASKLHGEFALLNDV